MRELEFLPAWYPQMRRRKRQVFIQAWATLLLLGGLALWMFLAQRNVHVAQASVEAMRQEVSQTDKDLTQLYRLLEEQKSLGQQSRVRDRLGLNVEVARLVAMLETTLGPETALIDLNIDTEEAQTRKTASLAAVKAMQSPEQTVERHLKVKLIGVAPTDLQVADVLKRLSNLPFLEQVALGNTKERTEKGRLMREFDVTFSLNLTMPATAE